MMRLWNRKNPDSGSSSVTPNATPKRQRLRESNSIEDNGAPNSQSSSGGVRSPKPSAKAKKMDQEHHPNHPRKTFSQLVQNHDTRNHSEPKKGTKRQFKVFFFVFLNIFGYLEWRTHWLKITVKLLVFPFLAKFRHVCYEMVRWHLCIHLPDFAIYFLKNETFLAIFNYCNLEKEKIPT